MKRIDIVLPCYNPPQNWVTNIKTNFFALKAALPDIEVRLLVVNDGSPNMDRGVVVQLKALLPDLVWISYDENKGKGFALRKGVAACDADIVVFTDIDFPYENESILSIIHALDSGTCDIAVGVRPDSYYEKVPFVRRLISKTLRAVIGVLFRMPITDTQCGLKGFNQQGKKVFLDTTIERYLFDLEFVFLASQIKTLRLSPVVVHLKPNIIFTAMNYNILLVEGRNFFKVLLRTFLTS
jgi:glycosyltransferase involved in cell wall biosynthesis